ncbi:MAG TPA: hypothetical protein VL357_05400 [Rariglobus sp.]|jgi:hypothetical protein|nr:hypothetical protein [Rariglobus sp.]
MKPIKLLACLVTLQLTSSLTLQAADPQDFRKWTDTNGRTITAKLIDAPDASSVKIQREDGRTFVVSLKTFSSVDQAYVKASLDGESDVAPAQESAAAYALDEVKPVTWALLNSAGSQPGTLYSNTQLDRILDALNRRITAKEIKTAAGLPLKVRTEPADLAERVKLTGELPDMATAAFVKKIAEINDLEVKTDSEGMLVIVDKSQPVPVMGKGNYFGVTMNSP